MTMHAIRPAAILVAMISSVAFGPAGFAQTTRPTGPPPTVTLADATTTAPAGDVATTTPASDVATTTPASDAAATGALSPAMMTTLRRMSLPDVDFLTAVMHEDVDVALRRLAAHFAARTPLQFPPELFGEAGIKPRKDVPLVYDTPDHVLRNEFAFITEYVTLPPGFDWNGRFGRGDSEITWWVNRFFFLRCLRQAHERTGESRYPRYGIKLMLDWIDKNPIQTADGAWAAWRTLEIGLRLTEWSQFIDYCASKRLLSSEELARVLASVVDQTQFLATRSGPHRGNWGYMEQCGIATVALTFPEIRFSQNWLRRAFEVYKQDATHQVYPDGSQEELSVHYEATVVISMARVVELARQRRQPVPTDVLSALRRATTYLVLTSKPDGTLPMLNDGDAVDLSPMLEFVAKANNLGEARYALSHGNEGGLVPPLCRLFPNSGVAILRDAWKPDARWLLMDAGPYGTGHQHEDALAIDVCAFGRNFIVDPGRYTYAADPLREYFHGTKSHATIRIDGADQRRGKDRTLWRGDEPLVDRFAAKPRLALAVGDYKAGYDVESAKQVTHSRAVLFVDDTFWVVRDVVRGELRHRVEQDFQYTPGPLEVTGNRAVTGHPDANLAMLWLWPTAPAATVETGKEAPHVGWYSSAYGHVEPAPHLALTGELDLPADLLLVLVPFRGATPPRIEATRLPITGAGPTTNAAALDVAIDGKHTIVLIGDPRDPPQPRTIGGWTTSAAAAMRQGDESVELPAAPGTKTAPAASRP